MKGRGRDTCLNEINRQAEELKIRTEERRLAVEKEDEQVVADDDADDELECDKWKDRIKLKEEEEDKRIELLRNEVSELKTTIQSLTKAYKDTKWHTSGTLCYFCKNH